MQRSLQYVGSPTNNLRLTVLGIVHIYVYFKKTQTKNPSHYGELLNEMQPLNKSLKNCDPVPHHQTQHTSPHMTKINVCLMNI